MTVNNHLTLHNNNNNGYQNSCVLFVRCKLLKLDM